MVLFIKRHLLRAAAVRFRDSGLHGVRHLIRVENRLAFQIPGRAADRLHETPLASEEALLIRVQNGDE